MEILELVDELSHGSYGIDDAGRHSFFGPFGEILVSGKVIMERVVVHAHLKAGRAER